MKAAELKTTLAQNLPQAFPGSEVSYAENNDVPVSHFGTFNVALSAAKTSAEILQAISTVVLKNVSITQQSGDVSKLQGVLYLVGNGENVPRITINNVVSDTGVKIFTVLIIKPLEEKKPVRIPLPRKPSTTS